MAIVEKFTPGPWEAQKDYGIGPGDQANVTTTWDTKAGYFVECQACEDASGPKGGSYKDAFDLWNRFAAGIVSLNR